MPERIDNRVHERRTASGLTQEALAQMLGVSRQTVIAIEKGNYAPSVHLALRIAAVFKTRVEEIFSITHTRS